MRLNVQRNTLIALLASAGCSSPPSSGGSSAAITPAPAPAPVVALTPVQPMTKSAAPVYSRTQRMSRYLDVFNAQVAALEEAGIAPAPLDTASPYPQHWLLDPRKVQGPNDYALERAQSYIQRLTDQLAAENNAYVAPARTPPPTPAGFVTPEQYDSRVGARGTDATAAVEAALASSNAPLIWLTPGKVYEIRHEIEIPDNAEIASDGTGTILVATAFVGANPEGVQFTAKDHAVGDYNDVETDLQPLDINGRTNVYVHDIRVQEALEPNVAQPVLDGGIQIRGGSNVVIAGVELVGFPRTLGALRVESGNGVTLEDNLIHGSYTIAPMRQVTGLLVDDERNFTKAGDVVTKYNTQGLAIVGNFILGVILDSTVYFDTHWRDPENANPAALGYETDGINTPAGNPPQYPYLVDNNTVMDVGEALDNQKSQGVIRNNHFERIWNIGFKCIYYGENSLYVGNRIIATGMNAVTVGNPGYIWNTQFGPVDRLTFIENRFAFNDAFQISTFPKTPPVPDFTTAGVMMNGDIENNQFVLNQMGDPGFSTTTTDANDHGAFGCDWTTEAPSVGPAVPPSAPDASSFWENTITGYTSDHQFYRANSESKDCMAEWLVAPLLDAPQLAGWEIVGGMLQSGARSSPFEAGHDYDRLILDDTTGGHEIYKSVSLAGYEGKPLTFSTLVRADSVTSVMLRDQSGNWDVSFDLTGDGTTGITHGNVTGRVYRLTSDWYFVAAAFDNTVTNAVMTIRALNGTSGSFADFGDARIDTTTFFQSPAQQ